MAAPTSRALALLCDQIEGAALGGVDFVQVRERDLAGGALAALVREALARLRGSPTRLLVNDRLDVALVTACHGVHLREDSVTVPQARRLSPRGFIVGRAVHDARGADASRDADYLVAGTVFETPSKPGVPAALGIAGLRSVVAAARGCPVWALGGLGPDTLAPALAAGASGVAAIGAFIPPQPTDDLVESVRILSERLRFSFDTSGGVSLN